MSEIDRILKEVSDAYAFTGDDLKIIKQAMIKAVFAAMLDNGVALSIMAHVEREIKNEKRHERGDNRATP